MSSQFTNQTTLINVQTQPHSFHMITEEISHWLRSVSSQMGTVTIFVRHSSASLTIQENADPTVREDLIDALDGFAPEDRPYRHHMEGPDDMPGHIKTMLTDSSLTIPVIEGHMDLGIWQGVYLIEHRAQSHSRSVRLMFQGVVG